jgi:hypothetical protein
VAALGLDECDVLARLGEVGEPAVAQLVQGAPAGGRLGDEQAQPLRSLGPKPGTRPLTDSASNCVLAAPTTRSRRVAAGGSIRIDRHRTYRA